MLHEIDEDIPVKDYFGREMSYISAGWYRFSNAAESIPPDHDALSQQRHAASPEALREVLENEPPEPERDDEPEMSDEFMERMSRLFSPADFVTRDDDDMRERIRASFTPEDFIVDEDEEEHKGADNILHILALYGKNYFDPAKMISVACEHGIDPNAESSDGALPLMLTFYNNNALCAYALLKAGADITKEDSDGETVRDKLNDENYRDIDLFRKNVFFSWRDCAHLMFIEVVRSMLYGRGEPGNILIAAAFDGDVRKIRSALDNRVDINVQTVRGYTPLMLAAVMGHSEAVKLLVERGADVNIRDNFGNNVVALARDEASLKIIAEAGAEIDSPDKYGVTPVMFPVFPAKIPVLAELGADINRKTLAEDSALTLAADHDNYEVVEALLRAGADPSPLIMEE